MSQVPTELAPRTMAAKVATPVRMSYKGREWESGVEGKEGQSLRRSPTEDMEIWAGKCLEIVFRTALGGACGSVGTVHV